MQPYIKTFSHSIYQNKNKTKYYKVKVLNQNEARAKIKSLLHWTNRFREILFGNIPDICTVQHRRYTISFQRKFWIIKMRYEVKYKKFPNSRVQINQLNGSHTTHICLIYYYTHTFSTGHLKTKMNILLLLVWENVVVFLFYSIICFGYNNKSTYHIFWRCGSGTYICNYIRRISSDWRILLIFFNIRFISFKWSNMFILTCNKSSRFSMYSIAFLNISTFGNLWFGFVLVRRFNTSNASLTCE